MLRSESMYVVSMMGFGTRRMIRVEMDDGMGVYLACVQCMSNGKLLTGSSPTREYECVFVL